MGTDGISIKKGLTSTDYEVALVKLKMISASKQLVVLSDHTKIDQVS